MTTNPIERLDVPLSQLTAEIVTHRAAARVEPMLPECFHCGDRRGPWVPDPSGARWPSGAQVMECQGRCTAADPVAALKAARITAGVAAECRHLLYDADPDSTVPPLVDLHHHQSTRRRTR